MSKGQSQLETLVHAIVAILVITIGVFGISQFLMNLEWSAEYELTNLDYAVFSKKILSSTDCFSDNLLIEHPKDPSKKIRISYNGLLNSTKVISPSANCFQGFNSAKYKVAFYKYNSDWNKKSSPFRTFGSSTRCDISSELIVRYYTDSMTSTEPGLVEVCLRER